MAVICPCHIGWQLNNFIELDEEWPFFGAFKAISSVALPVINHYMGGEKVENEDGNVMYK